MADKFCQETRKMRSSGMTIGIMIPIPERLHPPFLHSSIILCQSIDLYRQKYEEHDRDYYNIEEREIDR